MDKQEFIKLNNDLLKNIINNNLLKENTKTSYINCYYRICRELEFYIMIEILNNPNIYCKKINNLTMFTEEYSKKIYVSLLSLMNYNNFKIYNRKIYNTWYGFFNTKKKMLYKKSLDQTPTERQKESYVPWEYIVEMRDKMNKIGKEYILMCILTMLPPRRQLDWFNIIVYNNHNKKWKPNKDQSTENYINIGYENPYILLTNYKTSKFYGKWYKQLNEPLLTLLKTNYMEEESILFSTKTNKKYETIEGFTSWTNSVIKRVLNKKNVSMNTLRHSYVSYIFKTKPNLSLLDRKILAKDMGHSIVENMMYDIHN
jgi:hypothetical protein